MSLIDSSMIRYGLVEIGSGAIIEPNVILGHPAAADVLSRMRGFTDDTTLFAFYDMVARVSGAQTKIGRGAIIRSGTVIYAGVSIGEDFDCGHNVIVREQVEIGNGVYLKNNAEIMKRVRIGYGSRVSGVIADDTVVGARVSTFGVLTHSYSKYVRPALTIARSGAKGEASVEPPVPAPRVEDDAIVGRGAVVVGGVTVGRGALVESNAVVLSDVASSGRVVARRGREGAR